MVDGDGMFDISGSRSSYRCARMAKLGIQVRKHWMTRINHAIRKRCATNRMQLGMIKVCVEYTGTVTCS